jgi:hypothetical protein
MCSWTTLWLHCGKLLAWRRWLMTDGYACNEDDDDHNGCSVLDRVAAEDERGANALRLTGARRPRTARSLLACIVCCIARAGGNGSTCGAYWNRPSYPDELWWSTNRPGTDPGKILGGAEL